MVKARSSSKYEEAKVKTQFAKEIKASHQEDQHLMKHGPKWAQTSQLGVKKKMKVKTL